MRLICVPFKPKRYSWKDLGLCPCGVLSAAINTPAQQTGSCWDFAETDELLHFWAGQWEEKEVRKETGRLLPEPCVLRSSPGEGCGMHWLDGRHSLDAESSKQVFLIYYHIYHHHLLNKTIVFLTICSIAALRHYPQNCQPGIRSVYLLFIWMMRWKAD